MDGEDKEYSERTSFFWLVLLFYTLFLSHRILFHSLRLLAYWPGIYVAKMMRVALN